MLGLAEANIQCDCNEDTLKIDGYRLERDNLTEVNIRNRTAVYIKSSVQYRRRYDLEPVSSPIIWIEFNVGSPSAWLLFTGYREWRTLNPKNRLESGSMTSQLKRLDQWDESWRSANAENKPMFIMCDSNIDVRPWLNPELVLTLYQKQMKTYLTKLKEMASSNGLTLLPTPPTRSQGQDAETTIDIVMSNMPQLIQTVELIQSSSDHCILLFTKDAKIKVAQQQPRTARCFKEYSKEKMLNSLNLPMLNSLLFETDPNLVANVLVSHITSAIDIVAPIKTVQIRHKYAPHLTPHSKHLMEARNALRVTYNSTKLLKDEIAFKKARNLAVKSQRSDRKMWAIKIIEKTTMNASDSKALWKAAKIITGEDKKESVNKLVINGTITENKKNYGKWFKFVLHK